MPAAAWAARSGDTVLLDPAQPDPAAPTRKAIAAHERARASSSLGPPSAISDKVVKQLGKLGKDDADRRAEAGRQRDRVRPLRGGRLRLGRDGPGYNFTVAGVSRPLNAAAAATLATRGVFAPLLLTDSAAKLPAALESYFLSVQPGYEDDPGQAVYNRVWILGDDAQVSVDEQAADRCGDRADPGPGERSLGALLRLCPDERVRAAGADDARADRRGRPPADGRLHPALRAPDPQPHPDADRRPAARPSGARRSASARSRGWSGSPRALSAVASAGQGEPAMPSLADRPAV